MVDSVGRVFSVGAERPGNELVFFREGVSGNGREILRFSPTLQNRPCDVAPDRYIGIFVDRLEIPEFSRERGSFGFSRRNRGGS